MTDINIVKKDNMYVFLSTSRFKCLDVRNYLAPGLSYDGWYKANGYATEKLVFPYEWLDEYGKLIHVGSIAYEAFFSSLKGNPIITCDEYDKFLQEFSKRGYMTMMDWLRIYSLANVFPFIEALERTRNKYHPDKIDMLKDAVIIPVISLTYVFNRALKTK